MAKKMGKDSWLENCGPGNDGFADAANGNKAQFEDIADEGTRPQIGRKTDEDPVMGK